MIANTRIAVVLLAALASAAVARDAGRPAAPAATAPAGKGPDDARALAERRMRQFGEGYSATIDSARHIVYVSAVDARNFRRVVKLLSAHHDVQRKLLFRKPLKWNVTVVLPTLKHYRKLSPPPEALGFYHWPSRSLYSISFSNVLVHEFIHALHHNDMVLAGQRHPIWLVEGLATLFQRSRFSKRGLEILDDPGLEKLQEAIKSKSLPSISRLFAMDQKAFMAGAALSYRQARYVVLYLHERGKLAEYYAAFKAGWGKDPSGIKALEKVLGESPERIGADWRRWVLSRKPPWRPGYELKAHLGVKMQQTPEGVKVTALIRGSAARKVGIIRPGDVIISVAGRPTPTPPRLTEAVQSCRPGNIVNIEVIRDDRTVVLKHLLGLMPK